MTYCCGILVRDGLVMIADTRTNAGLDNISTFRKLHVFAKPGERIMAIATAGNLAISQSVVSTLTEGMENPETGELETLINAPTMFQAAQRIGHAIRQVHDTEGEALRAADVKFDVSFLFGGQIKGARLRLFMIYSAGNFIECTVDTPYLQIGEHKYGKPVLDRAISYDVDLYDALKIGLISMDSTMRSNLGVGMPIDVLVVRPRRLRRRSQSPHRAGRALLPRPARALVGGAARRAPEHPAPALQGRQSELQRSNTSRKNRGDAHGCSREDRARHRRRHRHRPRRGAGADEGRLSRGAGRPPQGHARRDREARRQDRGKSLVVPTDMTEPDVDRRAVRQDEGDLRPARPAVQQCRHAARRRCRSRTSPSSSGRRSSTPTSPRRSCARRRPSAS